MQKFVNRNQSLPEVFAKVSEFKSTDEKVAYLSHFKTKHLMWVVNFMYNFDSSDLYVPVYKNNNTQPGISYMNLSNAWSNLEIAVRLFQQGKKDRYERTLVKVLESVSSDEAKLIEDLFNGKKVKGISKTVWKRIFPEFFRTEEEDPSDQA